MIPFEIRTLKIGHTEQRRTQRFYIVAIVRHRGTVGAWRNRGYLRVLLMLLSTSLQSSGLQDFLKRLLPKLSATRTLLLCRSLCLRHLREIVCFHLRVLPLSVCPFICSRLTLSIHISEEPNLCPSCPFCPPGFLPLGLRRLLVLLTTSSFMRSLLGGVLLLLEFLSGFSYLAKRSRKFVSSVSFLRIWRFRAFMLRLNLIISAYC